MPAPPAPTHPPTHATDVPRLLEFLQERDAPCPLCGYNLRSLTRPECPECRHPLVLAVGVRDLRFGWFIATIAPGLFSGIAAAFLAIPIVLSPLKGGGPAPWFVVATDAFGWLSGVTALLIIAQRYRFLRQRRNAQMAVALVTWGVHALAFTALLLMAIFA
jgi:hypothetical protein